MDLEISLVDDSGSFWPSPFFGQPLTLPGGGSLACRSEEPSDDSYVAVPVSPPPILLAPSRLNSCCLLYDGGIPYSQVIALVASIPTGTAAGLFANWLWHKLKDRSIRRIEIDRMEVEFDEGQIRRIIHEKFTQQAGDVQERSAP